MVHRNRFCFSVKVGHHHRDVTAKFPDKLAAGAARRSQRVGIGNNGDGGEAAFAFADGFEDGGAFGADSQAVSGVFDVAATVDFSGQRE